MSTYVSPDAPVAGGNFLEHTYQGYQDQQQYTQGMYYGGTYGFGYPQQGFDPDSRRVNMYPQQTMPLFNQQPVQPQSYTQPIAPFSSYGGSGAQQNAPVMPTLDSRRTFQAPFSQQTYPAPVQQPAPTWMQPNTNYGAFIRDDKFVPIYGNQQIPVMDRKQQMWDNVYVQPQTMPMPTINWQPVQQPAPAFQYGYQAQCPAFVQQPSVNMTWTETWLKNCGAL